VTPQPHKDNICAAIVTYNPDEDFPRRVARIAHQVHRVLIIDNCSDAPAMTVIQATCSRQSAYLIRNTQNLGLGAALNQAARWARDHGYSWVLTLDQDSIVAEDLAQTLARIGAGFDSKDRVAIIGSTYVGFTNPMPEASMTDSSRPPCREEKTVITSGSLLSLLAFETIGPFREDFFIDLVDLEYCLRARSKRFKVVLSLTPTMRHALGAVSTHRILGIQKGTSNHSPERRYYMMRNHVVLIREYFLREPEFVLSSLYSRVKSIVLLSLFEKQRLRKLAYTALGVWDGLTLRLGKRFG
jgi:rhamnosyltransferase